MQAVLFHCSHGKDRTGIIAALLLKCAGVSDEDVITDYALSVVCPGSATWYSSKKNYHPMKQRRWLKVTTKSQNMKWLMIDNHVAHF
jgi:hypothetical protein